MDWITTSTLLHDLHDHERAPAWERFVAHFRPPITRFAVRCGLSAADAEDVAQEALTSFLEAYGRGAYDRRQGRLGPWLFGIAYNHVQRERRRRARGAAAVGADTNRAMRLAEVPAADEASAIWERAWEESVLAACLAQARRETQPTTFRAFELVVVAGCKPREAATALGVPVRVVYNAKHRVLGRIRELRDELEALPGADAAADPSAPADSDRPARDRPASDEALPEAHAGEVTAMPCVELEDLEGYVTGVSNGTPRGRVAEHLSSCAACRRRLAQIEANLAVGAAVRRATGRVAPATVAVPERIGPYRIERELGRGGMGVVYAARQEHPERTVALKLIRPDLVAHETSATMLRRFEQEANVLARLRHPGIARVYDAGVAEVVTAACRHDQPFLAMELVTGSRLDAFAEAHRLDRRARLELIARIADAVHHAHVKGVIHRDLKPSNILVEDEGPDGPRPRILDFGVARVVSGDRQAASWETDAGKLLGTLPYMSPEQVAGDAAGIDARSDVYSLGVLAFELVTGELPYDLGQRSLLEAARIVRDREPRRAGVADPALRGDVETIVATALEKTPERRYQSAAELAADIRRFLRHEPITARPATTLYQVGKFARRHRALVAGATVAVLALVVGLGGAVWQARAARAAEADAERRLDEAVRQADYLLNTVSARLQVVLGTLDLRLAIGEQVHELFEDLAAQHPDHRLVQQRLWESERVLAGLAGARGDHARRLALLRTSHDRVRRAFERDPRDPELRFQLAYSLRSLSGAIARRDAPAAEALVREARGILDELVAAQPDDPVSRRELANVHTYLAAHARARGDLETAGALLRDALAHAERTAELEGHRVRSGALRAVVRTELAGLAAARGDGEAAERWYGEVLEIDEALAERAPNDVRVHHGIVRARTELAELALADGRPLEAIEHARAALERRERLAEGEQGRPGPWQDVAAACDLLACAARTAGLAGEAQAWAERAEAARDRARRAAAGDGARDSRSDRRTGAGRVTPDR